MKNSNFYPKKSLFLLVFLLSSTLSLSAQIYVDHAATGANNGSSWADAYTDLQDALANAGENAEIRVAQGIYLPGPDSSSTFLIEKQLQLLGGYNASTGERDPEAYETVLSGDVNGDDVEDDFVTNREDNIWTVVVVNESVLNEAVIDGFTIRNGHAHSDDLSLAVKGGGLRIDGAVTVSNCIIEQNYAYNLGGGASCGSTGFDTISFEHCIFRNNYATRGGAVDIRFRDVYFTDCSFIGNVAMATLGQTFSQNGGAINTQNSNCFFRNCTFDANEAVNGASSLFFWVDGQGEDFTFEMDSCTFTNNISQSCGAAISQNFGKNTTTRITNSTFLNNETTDAFAFGNLCVYNQVAEGTFGNAVVENCNFEGNISTYSSGAIDIGSGPGAAPSTYAIKNSTFKDNSAAQNGGALSLWSELNTDATFLIDSCTFEGNQAGNFGGGLVFAVGTDDFSAAVSHCTFKGNQSEGGGAIASYPDLLTPATPTNAMVKMDNCLITNNTSNDAAITFTDLLSLDILNCTAAGNNANGITLEAGNALTLQNTILYNEGYIELEVLSGDAVITSNGGNLIGDGSLAAYAHPWDLQNENPLFVGQDDFHLTEASPAVDAGFDSGDNSPTDLEGNDRIVSCIDIGAYESEFNSGMACLTAAREVTIGAVKLSPNPATDFLTVQLPDDTARPGQIRIFDAQGKLIERQSCHDLETLQVGHLPAGLYVLKLTQGERVYVGKFVKK